LKTIAVSLQKGGTGKTSLAVSIAAELAANLSKTSSQTAGAKALLIDCDPQGSSSSWLAPENLSAELADVLIKTAPLKEAIVETEFPALSILPSAGLGGSLKTFAETQVVQKPYCIKNVIKDIQALGYAYCVLDLSPGWGALERAAALASDEIITPIMPDIFGIDGLQIFYQNLAALRENMNLSPRQPAYNKIIVNAIDHRIRQHEEVLATIKRMENTYRMYYIPVEPAFRKAQASKVVIQALSGVKPETAAELNRLIQNLIQE
jgi:chromosome partitioning protein